MNWKTCANGTNIPAGPKTGGQVTRAGGCQSSGGHSIIFLIAFAIGLLAMPAAAIDSANCKGPKRFFTFDYGIEQWTNGKDETSPTSRRQIWSLKCFEDHCRLERTVIDQWGARVGTVINTHVHSSSDGSLNIHRLDWSHGAIRLDIILDDGSVIKADIDFDCSAANGRYLKNFKAASVAAAITDGKTTIFEYKIPGKTYNFPIEVRIRGLDD